MRSASIEVMTSPLTPHHVTCQSELDNENVVSWKLHFKLTDLRMCYYYVTIFNNDSYHFTAYVLQTRTFVPFSAYMPDVSVIMLTPKVKP